MRTTLGTLILVAALCLVQSSSFSYVLQKIDRVVANQQKVTSYKDARVRYQLISRLYQTC